jgi:hypothetical protein
MSKKLIKKDLLFYLIILIMVLAVFFPVSFLLYPVKWDFLDCMLPWRFIVGESIRNGDLPWWNAFQSLGYPLHADLQVSPWYMPVWLVSLITPYTLVPVQYEYLFHLVIGGIGVFWLSKKLKVNNTGSLIMAFSYAFCGVMVGNAQHHHHIVAAAWLPFVIGCFYELLIKPVLKQMLKFAFFSWLFITGGYAGVVIVLPYVLFTWFLIHQYLHFRKNKTFDLKALLAVVISGTLIVLLSLPQLVSILQSMPYNVRQSGITLEEAQIGPFTPHSFISFILPYTTVKDDGWFGTDISMANIYFGLGALCFAIVGIFNQGKKKWFIIAGILISLAASLGEHTPFRAFLFHYVPLFNFSRFPAIYRIFTIFLFLMLAILGWKLLEKDFKKYIKHFRYAVAGLIFIMIFLFIYYIVKTEFPFMQMLKQGAFKESPLFFNKQYLLFQTLIQGVILICVLAFSFLIKNYRKWSHGILIFIIIDLGIAANLNMPFTVYDANGSSFQNLNSYRNNFTYGFGQVHDYKVCETDSICKEMFKPPLWRNTSNLNKHVTNTGFTSFFLKSYDEIFDKRACYLDSLLKNKVAFITTDVRADSCFDSDIVKRSFRSNSIYSESLKMGNTQVTLSSVENIRINPSKIDMIVHSDSSAVLVLLQSYYPYWKAYVDGRETEIYKISKSFMGIPIQKTSHFVEFRYENGWVLMSFFVSLLTIIFIIFILVAISINNHRKQNKSFIIDNKISE